MPEECPELVLEVGDGIEVVEEDREHPLDSGTIAAESAMSSATPPVRRSLISPATRRRGACEVNYAPFEP